MIHDTAQGQTQYDLCAELRAQVVELAKERDDEASIEGIAQRCATKIRSMK